MSRLIALLLAIVGIAWTASAADPPRKAPTTEAFLAEVAVGNQFEIDSSRLAYNKSKSEPVRNYANKLFMDHTEAASLFSKAIAEAKLKLPSEGLDAKHKAILDDLAKKDGEAFDRAYIQAQQKAHQETVALFEAYARGGDNPEIKALADKLLPTLRSHLEHAGKLP